MHKPNNKRCSCGAIVEVGKRCRQCSAQHLYNSYRWQRLRRYQKQVEPLCQHCLHRGVINKATDVDHIRPHRGDERLFYDEHNLQSLCNKCHGMKTKADNA